MNPITMRLRWWYLLAVGRTLRAIWGLEKAVRGHLTLRTIEYNVDQAALYGRERR